MKTLLKSGKTSVSLPYDQMWVLKLLKCYLAVVVRFLWRSFPNWRFRMGSVILRHHCPVVPTTLTTDFKTFKGVNLGSTWTEQPRILTHQQRFLAHFEKQKNWLENPVCCNWTGGEGLVGVWGELGSICPGPWGKVEIWGVARGVGWVKLIVGR